MTSAATSTTNTPADTTANITNMMGQDHGLSISPTAVGEDFSKFFLHHTSSERSHDVEQKDRVIRSMDALISAIPSVIEQRKFLNIEPGAQNDPVIRLLRRIELSSDEWSKFAFFDASKPYTRNLIATDHTSYTLLLLCWNPLEESPIHDHPCDGCWLRVLQGTVQECRYQKMTDRITTTTTRTSTDGTKTSTSTTKPRTQDPLQEGAEDQHQTLQCTSDDSFHEGEIAYITDSMGFHKVGNPTHQKSASLHLYAPPINQCRVWLPDEVNAKTNNIKNATELLNCSSATTCHYSEYGQLVQK